MLTYYILIHFETPTSFIFHCARYFKTTMNGDERRTSVDECHECSLVATGHYLSERAFN